MGIGNSGFVVKRGKGNVCVIFIFMTIDPFYQVINFDQRVLIGPGNIIGGVGLGCG